jgi:hypothetical protein
VNEEIKQGLIELQADDLDVLVIDALAGAGKTYQISIVKNFLESQDIRFIAHAPTGPACEVLSRKIHDTVHTVHSTIYALDEDRSTDTRTIFKTKSSFFEDLTFIGVDEAGLLGDASQVGGAVEYGSTRLLSDFFQYYSGECKFIFVGDSAQLPAPFEENSPALDPIYLKKKFNLRAKKISLTGNFRQENADLINFAKSFVTGTL